MLFPPTPSLPRRVHYQQVRFTLNLLFVEMLILAHSCAVAWLQPSSMKFPTRLQHQSLAPSSSLCATTIRTSLLDRAVLANPRSRSSCPSLDLHFPHHSLWQLVYQTFVFISRSSLSILHLPPIPIPYLPLPTLFQLALLLFTSLESARGYLEASFGENGAIWVTFGMSG